MDKKNDVNKKPGKLRVTFPAFSGLSTVLPDRQTWSPNGSYKDSGCFNGSMLGSGIMLPLSHELKWT